ncbi:TULIP family P47-like protein [Taibaiella soli]|uniref:Protein OrfX2/OrfX3/P47 domain-containing protein n=1 Tax=Taibaiella soli TaxID=1649169 RepID=A0A2W2B866_9BACT|nr:TULIP family P47-like protein [Taibaiella soli]PZF72469.1 hypothetical protein DN068_14070 [Taibaiella soli]
MLIADETPVFTFGWDTSFGIPVPDANKAIADKKSSPKNFNYSDDSFTLSANFGDWQICNGGSGKNVRFSIPLLQIVLKYASNGKIVKCDSGTAIMEVNMHYVPHTEAALTDVPSKPHALVIKTTATSEEQPAAVLVSLQLSSDVGTVSEAIIEEGLRNWLNKNLDTFNHIFSVVDLDRMIDKGKWAFVTPNYTSYAFLDGKDLNSSILGVLTMTGDRKGDDLANQISNDIIPHSSKAGFVISQKRTLYDLVRPAIQQVYPGLTEDNFLINDAGTKLYLKDGITINLKEVKHNGSTYHPVLKQLSVEATGQILTLQSYTETEIVAGIVAACNTTNWYHIELGNSKNGQTLNFKEAQTSDVQHTIHQSEGSIITELIIAIIAAIALLILTIATDGAVLIAGGFIAGLIMGADMIVPEVIQAINTDDSPSIDLMLINAVNPIRWTDSKDFKLDYASLNVSMQLGGNPLFI